MVRPLLRPFLPVDGNIEPSRSAKHALLFGLTAGVVSALLYFTAVLPLGYELSLLSSALREGQLIEFGAGLVIFAIFLAGALLIGLFAAGITAFPYVLTLSYIEGKHPFFRQLMVWGVLGAVFAMPMGLWIAWPSVPHGSDGLPEWQLWFFYLNVTCGFVGGLAAWFGYYRPVRSGL